MMQKILIVEDEISLNKAFTALLSKNEDYQVFSAYDGQEALDILEQESDIDLILLDLLMPNVDGKEFLRRYQPVARKPYIVAFSNLDNKEDIEQVQQLGVDRYVLKSWASPEDLMKLVNDTFKLTLAR